MGDAPYRDDRDADQARIAALETELKAARSKIDDLEGKRSQALVLASSTQLARSGKPSTGTKLAGAPMKLELARKFDFAFPTDKLEDLVESIREITRDRGRTELMRSSLAWWSSASDRGTGPFTSITVTVKGETTSLVVTDRLGPLAGAIYGGVGGGVGGGAIMLPIMASIAMPFMIPVLAIGWFGGIYLGSRELFTSRARKRA
jgi:hypothetical protein